MSQQANAVIFNFSHPLTESQLEAFQQDQRLKLVEVVTVKTQFDVTKDFHSQLVALLATVDVRHYYDTYDAYGAIYIVLPALAPIAGAVLLWMQSYFDEAPQIIRLAPVIGIAGTTYEYAETIDPLRADSAASKRRRQEDKADRAAE